MSRMTNTIRVTTKRGSKKPVGSSLWTTTAGQLLAHGPSDFNAAPTQNHFEPLTLPEDWNDDEYREASMEATVSNLVAWQVRVNREERGLTQAQLAALMGTRQSAISKLEDPDGGDVQLSTLVKAAHAFKCAVIVRFVDYGRFHIRTKNVGPSSLYACPFSDLYETDKEASQEVLQK
jgi:transcriptional regulator with XRE-family HTH domain